MGSSSMFDKDVAKVHPGNRLKWESLLYTSIVCTPTKSRAETTEK